MTDNKTKEQFIEIMEKFMDMSCKRLPDDVYQKLEELRETEDDPIQKVLYDAYFTNLKQAEELGRPCCQDTGLLHFYITVGSEFKHIDMVEDALREATHRATYSVPLRQNTVNYFEERNTEDNTGERMPWVHWNIEPGGNELEIICYFAGGGCCLPGRSQVFKPSDGYAAIVKYVFDTVSDLGINACPPLIVGVGLGHNMENAAMLSKKALMRQLGSHKENERAASMEKLLEDGINAIGLGPQGMGGKYSVMGVHIENTARHPSTIGVAVNVGCWSHRRGHIIFDKDLNYTITTHSGVTL